jgi:hypothetical protein
MIKSVPNLANIETITTFHAYLSSNDISVHHVNNYLKTSISVANYLGPEVSSHALQAEQQALSFLDTERGCVNHGPEMKRIITWNHY